MDRKIRRLQLAVQADLKDFYGDQKNFAFGMEFVVLLPDNFLTPLTCTLCSKVGILGNMLAHMNSIGHQVKVLKKTFPNILRQACKLYPETDKNFNRLIADIAHEIESQMGHQQPFVTSVDSYEANPNLINASLDREHTPSQLIEKLEEIIRKADSSASAKQKRERSRSPKQKSPVREKNKKKLNEPRRESRRKNRSEPSEEAENGPRKESRRRSEDDTRGRSKEDIRREKSRRERSHRTSSKAKKTERKPKDENRKRTHSPETSRICKKMNVEMSSAERLHARSSSEAQSKMTSVDLYMRHLSDDLTKLNLNYCRYSKCPQLHPRYSEEWNDFWLNEFYKLDISADPDTCDFTAQWNVHWPKRLIEMEKEDTLELRVNLRDQFGIPLKQSDREELKKIVMARKVKLNKKQPVVPIAGKGQNINVTIPPAPSRPLIDLSEVSSIIGQHVNLNDKIQSSITEADNNSVVTLSSSPSPNPSPSTNPFSAISNEDMTLMFGSFNGLSEGAKDNLIAVMENLRANDIERYKMLLETPVIDDDEIEENPSEEAPAAAESEASESSGTLIVSSDDNDDYWLGKLTKVIKTKKEDEIIVISDDEGDEGDEGKKETEPTSDIFFKSETES